MYDVGERIPNVPFDLARRHTRQRLNDTVLGTYSGSILSVESNKNVESKTKNVESKMVTARQNEIPSERKPIRTKSR